jgi:hypothetical protein
MTSDSSSPRRTTALFALAALIVSAGAVPLLTGPATADHQPADKAAVSGSSVEIMSASVSDGSASDVHTILSSELRASSPTDLIFHVNLECALWTTVETVGNDETRAEAKVEVWVEVDGEPVPVSTDDAGEDGRVVFCNREHRVVTENFENENATIERFLRTRTANSFNWVDLNIGSGTHEIEVKAQLTREASDGGEAKAGVGQRTLVVEPVKLSQHVSV